VIQAEASVVERGVTLYCQVPVNELEKTLHCGVTLHQLQEEIVTSPEYSHKHFGKRVIKTPLWPSCNKFLAFGICLQSMYKLMP
jgi:hypothetical protein